MTSKACSRCGQTKPLEEFPIDNRRLDGRKSRCRACQNLYDRARYDPVARATRHEREVFGLKKPKAKWEPKLTAAERRAKWAAIAEKNTEKKR